MSLLRVVYYSAVIGGWCAFIAWLVAEFSILRGDQQGNFVIGLTGAMVGAAIGAGLNAVAGFANGQWKQVLLRAIPGLIGGGAGGALGALAGNFLLAQFNAPRALGWMIMGLGIGVVEGIYDRSSSKIRNGLIGGGLGGLAGGILFDQIPRLIQAGSGMSSRATAFVILGLCIGALIGLAQVVLKEAWLTVLDGYRTGRQLILSRPVTMLGRADHLPLPFLGTVNAELEPEHVRIIREPDGGFSVEDNHTRLGTRLNADLKPLQMKTRLRDGDVIKFGPNYVRFNERTRRSDAASAVPAAAPLVVPMAPPPPAIKLAPPAPVPAAPTRPASTPPVAAPPAIAPSSSTPPSTPPSTGVAPPAQPGPAVRPMAPPPAVGPVAPPRPAPPPPTVRPMAPPPPTIRPMAAPPAAPPAPSAMPPAPAPLRPPAPVPPPAPAAGQPPAAPGAPAPLRVPPPPPPPPIKRP